MQLQENIRKYFVRRDSFQDEFPNVIRYGT